MANLKNLNEEQDIYRYIDDYTGNIYYFDGKSKKMVLIGNTGKKRKVQIGDKPMSQEAKDKLAQEDEKRKKLISKQNQEDGLQDETEDEYQARLKRIQDYFDDENTSKELNDETDKIVGRNRNITQGDKDTYFIYSGGIEAFKIDLKKLLAREFGDVRYPTWSRPDMSYEGTGVFVQGRKRKQRESKKPVFQIYYDQSGSWGYEDIKIGNDAIAILKDYEQKDLLDVNIFYFGDYVSTNPNDHHRGTRAGADIMKHIKSTSPDNVIIMTDGDLQGGSINNFPPLMVPGAAWHLFRDSVSKDVQSHIRGRKETKSYMI